MINRGLFFVAIVLFLLPSSALATEVLSYAELMQLSHENRIAYVAGVREILVDLSKQKNGRFSDSSPGSASKLRSWLEGLERQFPEAKADESEPSTSIFCNQDKSCREAMRSCFDANQTVTWSASMNRYICDSKRVFSGNSATALSFQRQEVLFREFQRNFKNPRTFSRSKSGQGETSSAQRDLFDSKPLLGPPRPTQPVRFGLGQTPLGKIAKSSVTGYVNAMASNNPAKYGCVSKHQTIGTGSEITRPCSETVEKRIAKDFEDVQSQAEIVEFSPRAITDEPIKLVPPSPAAAVSVAPPESSGEDRPSLETPAKTPAESSVDADVASESVKAQTLAQAPEPADDDDIVVSRKISNDEIQALLSQKLNPNRICEAESGKMGGASTVLVAVPGKDYRYCMTSEAQRLFESKKLTLVENDKGEPPNILSKPTPVARSKSRSRVPSTSPAPEVSVPTATSIRSAKSLSCAPVPEVCGDTKAVRGKIFQGELSCIFAGMVSQLDSQNRKCAPVTEFKLDSATYKCAAGQTMCNPLLFGTVSATKAICIGRGSDATAQCSKLSSARDAERFLNRNETGLQGKWDDFRSEFAKVCKPDSVQAKFHCNECNIMRTRLFDLHARILSDPCGSRTTGESAVDGRIRIRSAPTAK